MLIQAFDADGKESERMIADLWYDWNAVTTVAGGHVEVQDTVPNFDGLRFYRVIGPAVP